MQSERPEWKPPDRFDWYRYFARSFLLPLIGMAFVFVLALKGWKGPDLLYPSGFFAAFAGLFSVDHIAKEYIRIRWGKQGGAQ